MCRLEKSSYVKLQSPPYPLRGYGRAEEGEKGAVESCSA